MPVIGRLDDQVDDVLIKPLSRKGGREDAAANPAPQPPAAPTPGDGSPADEAPGAELPPRGELPVWLL